MTMIDAEKSRALFDYFPALRPAFPLLPLADLPTPVVEVEGIARSMGAAGLHIKEDGVTARPYGGNKVRKLEFLLGQAAADGVKSLITFGAAGSNHALATALYGKAAGFHCVSVLVAQPPSTSVRKNLLYHHSTGAEVVPCKGIQGAALQTLYHFNKRLLSDGQFPRVIPPGGSAPLGVVGYVNAACELVQQWEAGVLPKPDCIYVASGTMGTCVGLALGFAALGHTIPVHSVRVTVPRYTSLEKGRKLFRATNDILRHKDPTFPECPFPEKAFSLREDYFGGTYGGYTEVGQAAVKAAREVGIRLEGTYTGKAFAALLGDGARETLLGKQILFWNTCNAFPFDEQIEGLDYRELAPGFHTYFESELQALDLG